MSRFLHAFNASLIRRPMATQCATAFTLFGAGDILTQQALEKKGGNHDYIRTARVAFYGGAIFGPTLTTWLQFLNRFQFATPTKAVVYKVCLDQFVFRPGLIAMFFGSMTFLEGKGINDARERISESYVPTLVRNWGVFIPTQIVNFAVVPPHLHFLTIGIVSLFWNAYLSSVNAKKPAQLALEDEKKLAAVA